VNPAAEGGTMGEKWLRNFAESGDFHITFGCKSVLLVELMHQGAAFSADAYCITLE
jgi:hypothetical protein